MSSPGTKPVASLQDDLDQITQNTRALVQPDRLAYSESLINELFATGIEQGMLPPGARAPQFTLQDALSNKPVRFEDVLALGPVILKFFRGRWCPYCMTELEVWRKLYPELRKRGVLFLAISPQNRRHNDFTVQQHELPFPVLSDPEGRVAEDFGVGYTVPEEHRAYYQSILVNIPLVNAGATYSSAPDAAWRLPVPALFLVRQDGTIAFSRGYADFRVRPEPADVLAALEGL